MISLGMLRDIWAYRSFITGSVKREFQTKYKGTQFGAFWVIAHPLALILVYTIVFAKLMTPALAGHDYPFAFGIYLCAGVLTWGFFAELLGRSIGIFVETAGLLKKVSFPKICLPLIVVISSTLHFAIVLTVFLIFLLTTNHFPGWALLACIPVMLIQIAFSMGLGIFLATINVFYRDVAHSVSIILQFWFWLTPIVYVPSVLPQSVRPILEWNPMWPLIRAYQGIFLDKSAPGWESLVYPSLLALLFLMFGMFTFRRLQHEIVDEL